MHVYFLFCMLFLVDLFLGIVSSDFNSFECGHSHVNILVVELYKTTVLWHKV